MLRAQAAAALRTAGQGLSTPKRAHRGIWMGKRIMTGNNVSFSEIKTRRRWIPNLHTHRYYSFILQREVRVEVSTKAMRTIDKYGGLDPFLMYAKLKLIRDSHVAMSLREEMVNEWNKAKGMRWNASVAKFHDRKKMFEKWEEDRKNTPEGQPLPPRPKVSHYLRYDITAIDIHGYHDKLVAESAGK